MKAIEEAQKKEALGMEAKQTQMMARCYLDALNAIEDIWLGFPDKARPTNDAYLAEIGLTARTLFIQRSKGGRW